MGSIRMPEPVRKKNKDGTNKSDVWWLRKKVPERYRGIVGRGEVWRSLETTDFKTALVRCHKLSLELDKEWEDRLRAARAAGRTTAVPVRTMTDWDLSGLQRLVHEQGREAQIRNPPAGARWGPGTHPRSEEENDEGREFDEQFMDRFMERNGYVLNQADRIRFLPMFVEARRQISVDLTRAARHRDFSESDAFAKNAPSLSTRIDLLQAFEFYCGKAGIKGGATGATAKRWRPKIKAFCDFVGHSDLGRMTRDDAYRWVDHLTDKDIAKKSIREVWIASLRAVAGFQVERGKIGENPFVRIRVRGVKATKDSNKKGFSDAQAEKILSSTLATFSHLTTAETRAARRWVPWICAYTGARVNEITSLLPSDVRPDPETGIWCIYLRPEMTKGDYERIIPVHSHLIEQEFLDFVAKRDKARLPLFYDPKRAQGGENANPQWQKVAERLGEWVAKSLRVTGVKPNHGWRHRFKSVSRHVGMHPEVEKFITGHGGSDDPDEIEKVSLNYGDAWVKSLRRTIEMYPRYDIAALDAPPAPRRRVRRTREQIEADRGRPTDRSSAQA
jgi:integrase